MKNILFIIFLVNQLGYANDNIEISILTCSPGQEVYSVFGHSAIRVVDKEKNIDEIYNFGMFDFDTPHFEYKYLKGKLKYFRGKQKTKDFIDIYTNENRLVTEQVLDLTEQNKIELISRLQYLYRPENRYYLYSFLDKNCSTEIRDLLRRIGVNFQNRKLAKSNRDLINSYLQKMPWLKLGINMVLGKSLDKDSSLSQSMFLPEYLKKEIATSKMDGTKLVKLEQDLNSIENKKVNHIQTAFSPLAIFSIFALLFLFWFPIPIKILTCLIIGFTGLFILILWIFSGHEEVKGNLNLIWCNPLYLLYLPKLLKKKGSKILSSLLMGSLAITVFIWILKIQIFDISIIPILIILGILNFKEMKITWEFKNSPLLKKKW